MKLQATKHWNSDERAYLVQVFEQQTTKHLAIYNTVGKVLSGTRTSGSYGGASNTQPGLHRNIQGVRYWTAQDVNGRDIGYQYKTRKAAVKAVLDNVLATA